MEVEVARIFSSASAQEQSSSDHSDGPVDIIVYLNNNEKYIASFFSYRAIEMIEIEKRKSKSDLPGLYFWAKNMVIVEDCSKETVEKVVWHLWEEGEFWEAFEKL